MKTNFFFSKVVFFVVFFAFSSNYAQAQSNLHTTQEREIIRYMNQARTNPAAFARKHLSALKKTNKDARECYREMLKMSPRPALKASNALRKAARDHVKDIGSKGKTGHKGTDGSRFWERIQRYAHMQSGAENIQYGLSDPLEIVLDLLIDTGIPSRGHRKNILSPKYDTVGVKVGKHKDYGVMCVMDFASGVKPK